MTVLVIDDDPKVSRSVKRLLQDCAKVEVLAAKSGLIGLEQAAIHTPDVALVDWMLPDLHGLEVVRELRRWPRDLQPRTVITMTGGATEPLQALARALGVGRVLEKPLRSEDLLRALTESDSDGSSGSRAPGPAEATGAANR